MGFGGSWLDPSFILSGLPAGVVTLRTLRTLRLGKSELENPSPNKCSLVFTCFLVVVLRNSDLK